ncbi:armadillo-type protein [Chlamydoabsidia padenii]|nr:armadillo-type protein [Chlamydoabsidia padenii]
MARMTFGNTNMPKFCMQSLVRLVAKSKIVLVELLDYNIVDLISVCLRGDDVELIYWAAGLMHEFVLKDVASKEFRAIKGIHTILASLLSAEEMYISRVVLRTIKFMAYGDETFRQGMVKTNIVKKIMHCLTVNDDDVRYWAALCVHAVASQVESHRDILTAPEFENLLELALSKKVHAAIFVADILSLICCICKLNKTKMQTVYSLLFLCNIGQNDQTMEKHIDPVVTTLAALVSWNEDEVQYNSAGALFNLMAMQGNKNVCMTTIQVD